MAEMILYTILAASASVYLPRDTISSNNSPPDTLYDNAVIIVQFHDQVNAILVLMHCVQGNNVVMLDLGQDFDFRVNHAFFTLALGLVNDLDGIFYTSDSVCCCLYFRKGTPRIMVPAKKLRS